MGKRVLVCLLSCLSLLYKGYALTNRAKALRAFVPNTQRVSIGLLYTLPVF